MPPRSRSAPPADRPSTDGSGTRRRRRRGPRRLGAALATLGLLAGVADPTQAQSPEPPPPIDALTAARAELPEHLHGLNATSAALQQAESRVVALESTIRTNRTIRDEANLQLIALAEERAQHRARITSERERRRAAGVRAEQLRRELTELAVAAYVGGGRTEDALPLDAATATDAGRQQVLVDAVDSTLRERLAAAEAEVVDATAQADAARAALERVIAAVDETTARRDAAAAELARAEAALPVAQQDYRDRFMVATVDGSDMSVVAYDAYRQAAGSCGLEWTVLAGIGRVESRHGTYGGARPHADGRTSPRIIGIPLDGGPGVARIGDTDGGALDGDGVFDRAVGPMQFIPGTWRSFGRDGNGDGRADPHNLYDAAAAAAVYLCRHGNLSDAGNLRRAILSYNASDAYVRAVLGHRDTYRRLG